MASLYHCSIILLLFVHTLFATALFNGQAYTGSAEQLAQLDQITAEIQSRRAASTAEYLKELRKPIDITSSLNKHSNVTAQQIEDARKLVAAARDRWVNSYREYVINPRRNTYKHQQKAGSRKRAERSAPRDTIDKAVADATALLAEIDAAAQYRNGNLYKDYSQILTEHKTSRRSFVNSTMDNRADTAYWLELLKPQEHGTAPFANYDDYNVFRSVKFYGAKGDGIHDDTDAFNLAIQHGNRCGADCLSSTTKPRIVYVPAGTYLVSKTIIGYYNTQIVGNPNSVPVIKASADFVGQDGTNGVISSDWYIKGGGGQEWYLPVANFYRSVRNLRIDISAVKAENASCLHWQVGQATSIEGVDCIMSTDAKTTQRGIFAENGSGGYMGGLNLVGGAVVGGEQQFTANSIYFSHCRIGVHMIWDWGYSWRGIYVIGAQIAFKLVSETGVRGIGSFHLQDATIESTDVGVQLFPVTNKTSTGNTAILLDNVAFSNVKTPVVDTSGKIMLGGSNPLQVDIWSVGSQYAFGDSLREGEVMTLDASGSQLYSFGSNLKAYREPSLTSSQGGTGFSSTWYKYKQRPQYGDLDINGMINVRDYGAKGDGKTDDTAAFQAIFGYLSRKLGPIFIPHGVYLISDTIEVSIGTRVIGECWSQIMATGPKFQDITNPRVLIRVGIPTTGSVGLVEMSDLLITQQGKTGGLIGLQWNMKGALDTYPGMWDVHFRAGGATGGGLQVKQCPEGLDASCTAGSLLMHISPVGSGYFQNIWIWVADHDIDDDFNSRINVMVARGLLVESTSPTWLYGTSVEHATVYQYQFNNAKNVIASMIQTESPYFQGLHGIGMGAPYGLTLGKFPGDPSWSVDLCSTGRIGCDQSWALRILNSSSITIGGAGLYSWFDAYDQACVDTLNCQKGIVQIGDGSTNVKIYNLITIGAIQMVSKASDADLPLAVSSAENLYSPDHPWWSLVNVLSVNYDSRPIFPPHRNFFGLGDSYAAGIGASCGVSGGWITEDDPTEKGTCYKCVGAYSNQMHMYAPAFFDKVYKFYACSGGTTGAVLDPSTEPGFKSQVQQMKEYGKFQDFGWSTLSIGGNNVGFAEIAQSCLFFQKSDCEQVWAESEKRIASQELLKNLTDTYRQIVNLVTEPEYQLYVTGYGQFFNEETPACDKLKLLSKATCLILREDCPFLTKKIRTRANAGVVALNNVIRKATGIVFNELLAAGSKKKVIFVDVDAKYKGHRFCEPENKDSADSSNTWFFNVASSDVRADLAEIPDLAAGSKFDISKIDPATCTSPEFKIPDVPGRGVLCSLARYFRENNNQPLVITDLPDGQKPVFTIKDQPYYVLKALHPKTAAHDQIGQLVWLYYRLWNNVHAPRPPPVAL